MKAQFPIYIVSKGRWESRLTSKALEEMGQPYFIVVEEQEFGNYASVIDRKKILVLDKAYQRDYDTCDSLGDTKSKGPGPARNFAWDHAISSGAAWHWAMDDNIDGFWRINNNRKVRAKSSSAIRVMEDFSIRYSNVAMSGPQYFMFVSRKSKMDPFQINTRIYSCNLIRNDVPYRWRGRYNEDTDLSLRMLKDGWCTILFNVIVQLKTPTQQMKGGNTDVFYSREGTGPKSEMLVKLHPDVARMTWRFGRVHHYVDYKSFKKNALKRKEGIVIPEGIDNYGMVLRKVRENHLDEDLSTFIDRLSKYVAVDRVRLLNAEKSIRGHFAGKDDDFSEWDNLKRQWYSSVSEGHPDYSLYDNELVFADFFLCWRMFSSKYLAALVSSRVNDSDKTIIESIGEVPFVVDLGNGFGHSSERLSEIFQTTKVYATNIVGSTQWIFNSNEAHGYTILGDVAEIKEKGGAVFASEYFEHFEDPVEHLLHILNAINPSAILFANSFCKDGFGHFPCHTINGKCLDGRQTARAFTSALREMGYVRVKTSAWNNKPDYWREINAGPEIIER